jgi:indole-3-glycerol phosphate synthase
MLNEIVARTRLEVAVRKERIPQELFKIEGKTRSLSKAIKSAKSNAVITEIKPASPSEGMIREVDPAATAKAMEKGGACALSVLTEPFYFHGSLMNLRKAKDSVTIPVIRKDFIVDEYQLYEAKSYGADAVLLMVSVLGDELKRFYAKARELGMEALVEVHDEAELKTAIAAGAEIIGINNRNLKDLSIDLNTTKRLAAKVPKGKIIVSESGIKARADLDSVLKHAGAALVGTSLMKSADLEKAVREFVKR